MTDRQKNHVPVAEKQINLAVRHWSSLHHVSCKSLLPHLGSGSNTSHDVAFCVPVVHSLCPEECGNIARTQAQNVHFLFYQFYTLLTVTHSRSHPWAGMNRQVAIYSVAAGVGAVGLSVGLCLLGRKLVEWFRVRLLARGSKQSLTFECIVNHGRSLLEHCQLKLFQSLHYSHNSTHEKCAGPLSQCISIM